MPSDTSRPPGEAAARAQLLAANRRMKKLRDEGKAADAEIRQSRERLRNLSGRLQSLFEEERERIASAIHDELLQALTALILDLSMIRRGLAADGNAGQSAKIQRVENSVHDIIGTVRKIATELRPGILDELGVAPAIEWLAKDFQNRTGIRCTVALRAADKISDGERATAIFRVVQEALANVRRHAAASQVKVRLEAKGGTVILDVSDNGAGIGEEAVFGHGSPGLAGIRERVLALGGEAVIGRNRGAGTRVRVTLPDGNGADSNVAHPRR